MSIRRRWSLKGRLAIGLLLLLAVGGTWFYLDHVRILSSMGRYLDASSPTVDAELGYILGGGRSSRADYGAQFYHHGKVKRFLISGAGEVADVDGVALLSEQQLLDGMLRALGVPAESIEKLPEICHSTEDEAKALARYLKEHPGTSVVIITNDYHTRRCRWLFADALGPEAEKLQFAGAPSGNASPDNWWKSLSGSYTYLLEMMKLARECVPRWN